MENKVATNKSLFDTLVKTPVAYIVGFVFIAVGYYQWNQLSVFVMAAWVVSGLLFLPISKHHIASIVPMANSFRVNILGFIILVMTIPTIEKILLVKGML